MWNDKEGIPKHLQKTGPNATLSTTNPTHDLTCSRTRTAVVGSRQLTSYSAVRPFISLLHPFLLRLLIVLLFLHFVLIALLFIKLPASICLFRWEQRDAIPASCRRKPGAVLDAADSTSQVY
jgi:hypothetical protein